MRVVIQRVSQAQVTVDGAVVGRIGKGMVVLLAVGKADTDADCDYVVSKLVNLRIFEDAAKKMNCTVREVNGAFLIISQFTLLGDCRKGRRPSFDRAADPAKAEALYDECIRRLRHENVPVEAGKFGAMMDVSLVNDGPVTLILDSKDTS